MAGIAGSFYQLNKILGHFLVFKPKRAMQQFIKKAFEYISKFGDDHPKIFKLAKTSKHTRNFDICYLSHVRGGSTILVGPISELKFFELIASFKSMVELCGSGFM